MIDFMPDLSSDWISFEGVEEDDDDGCDCVISDEELEVEALLEAYYKRYGRQRIAR